MNNNRSDRSHAGSGNRHAEDQGMAGSIIITSPRGLMTYMEIKIKKDR